jgi:hypothetical protein
MTTTTAAAATPTPVPSAKRAASTATPWSVLVEERTAQCCALLLTTGARRSSLGWDPVAVMSTAAEVVAARPLVGHPGRHASARQQVACFTAVYGRYFTDAHPAGDVVADAGWLRWTDPSGATHVDVLRCGSTADELLDTTTRTRLLTFPTSTPGTGVHRVRLATLVGPHRSRTWDTRTQRLVAVAVPGAHDPESTGQRARGVYTAPTPSIPTGTSVAGARTPATRVALRTRRGAVAAR